MKIQCDVCEKGEASVFCVADEAALCDACDCRVHHANKLAGKHHRFSLLLPSAKQLPLCDICQKRRAFVFCQQDRAILCRECDVPIHKANEHTLKHNRYLLTGIKLSATAALYSSSSSSPAASSANALISNVCVAVPSLSSQDSANKPEIGSRKPTKTEARAAPGALNEKGSDGKGQFAMMNAEANGSASIMSDYLVDMLPEWHVEDFLNPVSPFCSSKTGGDGGGLIPFWDSNDFQTDPSFFSPKSTGDWVPQTATPVNPHEIQSFSSRDMAAFGGQPSFKQNTDISIIKHSRKWSDDNSFAVPQTNPPPLSSASNKRFRAFW